MFINHTVNEQNHKLFEYAPLPAPRLNTDSTFNIYVKPQQANTNSRSLGQRVTKTIGLVLRKTVQLVVLAITTLLYIISLGRIDFRSFDLFKSCVRKPALVKEQPKESIIKRYARAALNKIRTNRRKIANGIEVNCLNVAPNTVAHVQLAGRNLFQGKFKIAALFASQVFIYNFNVLAKMAMGKDLAKGVSEAKKNERAGISLIAAE